MALIACISTVLSCICQPVTDALQNSLQTAAQDLFSFLREWATREISGRFWSRRNAVEEVPVSSAPIIGAEETLLEIRSCLRDDAVGIVGIYGMGGAGKTTLLKQINNEFFESGTQGMFDLVVWVTVSREINVARIQKEIGDRVGLSLSASESADGSSQVDEQANLLFKALSKKRFLLLFDDLWGKLDLVKVGVPLPHGRINCKIAFTTRSQDVCGDMDAHKNVKVKLLDEARSWELFCTKLRTEAAFQNPSVQSLAKLVAAKCGGLPLALITVGRAMANKTLPGEWKHAVKALDDSAEKLRGMDDVLSALKFSYDNLQSDVMRSALLYCAMYPEDFDISREELIDYWVGEGLLEYDDDDEYDDDIDDARDRGHALIGSLQTACLLEAATTDAERNVKMHDAVRDMALWLNRCEYDKVDGILVFAVAGEKLTQVPRMPRKEHVRRIWMCNLDSELFPPCIPNCPNAWTLLLERTSLGPSIIQGLLESMRTLRVLDLSRTRLEEVPKEIALLVELQFLNLSYTWIESLPMELGDLIRLRQLLLASTGELRLVPWESIARLSNLQVLDMCDSNYAWDHAERTAIEAVEEEEAHQQDFPPDANASGGVGRQLELSDLEDLRRLKELRLDIGTSHSLERLLRSNLLCRCTKRLCLKKKRKNRHSDDSLYGENGALLQMAFKRMGGHLRDLELWGVGFHRFVGDLRFILDDLSCLENLVLHEFNNYLKVEIVEGCNPACRRSSSNGGGTSSYIPSFRDLSIRYCHSLRVLKLVGRFPCLELIDLYDSWGLQELVLGDDDMFQTGQGGSLDCDFPMLKRVLLIGLLGLKSISRRTLLLPSLDYMYVGECPRLRRLPLGPGSAPKLRVIHGEQEWWDALQWDDSDGGSDGSNSKCTYAPCFSPTHEPSRGHYSTWL